MDSVDTRTSEPESFSVLHRTAIKWLFVAVILSQPVQYLVVSSFGEPYPALMMPQFAGTVTDSNGNIRIRAVRVVVIFQDNGSDVLSTDKLLFPAPTSHQNAILQYVFGLPNHSTPVPASSVGVGRRIKNTLFPGLAIKYSRGTKENADPQTIAWLRNRLHNLYPSRNAKTVTFTWYQDIYSSGSAVSEKVRQTMGIYTIDLEGSL